MINFEVENDKSALEGKIAAIENLLNFATMTDETRIVYLEELESIFLQLDRFTD